MNDIPHLHRCRMNYLGGDAEQCRGMFECWDNCVEDDQETLGFCPKHELLAQELVKIIS